MKIPNKATTYFYGEAKLESDLRRYAPLCGCKYEKVPDAIKTKSNMIKRADGTYTMAAAKRPCDAFLSTPIGNIAIECKYNKGSLEPHQRVYMSELDNINGLAFVIRMVKVDTPNGLYKYKYSIEKGETKNKITYLETENIMDIFKYFKNLVLPLPKSGCVWVKKR